MWDNWPANPLQPSPMPRPSIGEQRRAPSLLGRTSERELLDQLLATARQGQSTALVVRGEAGIGKTALLHYAARQASDFHVARIAGIEAEMELPFAGVHQLCAPIAARLTALPEPQRKALSVALGLSSGAAPDRFIVALGRAQPFVCCCRGASAPLSRGRRAVA